LRLGQPPRHPEPIIEQHRFRGSVSSVPTPAPPARHGPRWPTYSNIASKAEDVEDVVVWSLYGVAIPACLGEGADGPAGGGIGVLSSGRSLGSVVGREMRTGSSVGRGWWTRLLFTVEVDGWS
jgi:hypothetical protein